MAASDLPHPSTRTPYAPHMAVSAHDVARALRSALPGVGVKKLHKLLYLSQGHHLAWFGVPIFTEGIHAWDMGPVVEKLWKDEKAGRSVLPVDPDEAAVNTVMYVVSRYGSLTGRDLEILSHGQEPWLAAERRRKTGGSDLIEHGLMRGYFSRTDRDEETPWPGDDVIAAWLADAEARRRREPTRDDPERLRLRAHGP